nr:hypothetical protein [Haloarcula hispanica]
MILTIYPIGFGGATRDQLSAIATATGGEVNFVNDAAGLPTVFSRVANTTTEINDTDGDGLSDEMEREGVILGGPNGDRVTKIRRALTPTVTASPTAEKSASTRKSVIVAGPPPITTISPIQGRSTLTATT